MCILPYYAVLILFYQICKFLSTRLYFFCENKTHNIFLPDLISQLL
jgi:hypothetical protein